jgi:hypothetical protein
MLLDCGGVRQRDQDLVGAGRAYVAGQGGPAPSHLYAYFYHAFVNTSKLISAQIIREHNVACL